MSSATRVTSKDVIDAARSAAKFVNDPGKIDNLFLRVLVWTSIAVPGYFFFTNADPYISMLGGVIGRTGPVITALGFILLCLVQYVEVRPFLIKRGLPNSTYRTVNFHALVAYGVDLSVCSHRWPIFPDDLIGFPSMGDVQWESVGSICAIVLGFGLWFMIRRVLGKVA